ncbi:MAG TPA: hypothetical protein VK587_02230, partial [bacterium]|nr:hypothetical protein [bacterium]
MVPLAPRGRANRPGSRLRRPPDRTETVGSGGYWLIVSDVPAIEFYQVNEIWLLNARVERGWSQHDGGIAVQVLA